MNAWKACVYSRYMFPAALAVVAFAGCGDDSSSTSTGDTTGTGGVGPGSTSSTTSTTTTTTGSMATTTTTTTGTMAGTGGATTTGTMAGTGGAGGMGGAMAGTGGAGGMGGASTTGSGGTGGTGGTGGGSPGCPTQNMVTMGTHITMAVTWPGTIGIEPGAGTVHIWTLANQTITGNTITGTGRPCGSIIPDLKATPIAGGMMIGNTIPDAAWDSPSMPVSNITGSQTGFDIGTTVTINKSATLVGATMPNPLTDPWPASYTGIMTADHDGNGKPGITANCKTGPGFQLPPTSLLMLARADQLYLATRSILSLSGTRDTCDSITGTAVFEKFDNHVVGCHVQGGADCLAADTQFVDDNRTIFVIGAATYKAVSLPAGSNCAAVRAALP